MRYSVTPKHRESFFALPRAERHNAERAEMVLLAYRIRQAFPDDATAIETQRTLVVMEISTPEIATIMARKFNCDVRPDAMLNVEQQAFSPLSDKCIEALRYAGLGEEELKELRTSDGVRDWVRAYWAEPRKGGGPNDA